MNLNKQILKNVMFRFERLTQEDGSTLLLSTSTCLMPTTLLQSLRALRTPLLCLKTLQLAPLCLSWLPLTETWDKMLRYKVQVKHRLFVVYIHKYRMLFKDCQIERDRSIYFAIYINTLHTELSNSRAIIK